MALPEMDSAVGHSFGLEFDGIRITQITEITGLKFEQDVIEYDSNTEKGLFVKKKMPGRPKAGEVTLERGLTADNSFDKWIKTSRFGQMNDARKGGAIIVFTPDNQELKRYNLINAWPKSLELTSMKAGSTEPIREKLVITYETLEPGS